MQIKSSNSINRPAVFIDRDGTLIEEVNFLSRVEDLKFFSFTDAAVKMLKEKGFLAIVLTNQSGIARGIFDEKAMHAIHDKIQNNLAVKLDGFYFCPHLPTDGCRCRKPNLAMVDAACRDFSIDLDNSWMIGDKALDVELGFNAKIKTALVLTGYGKTDLPKLNRQPDVIAENLLEAVEQIVSNIQVSMEV